jgi:prepilin-type N-terminal cleavage/methylation domain-containing protein
MSKTSAKFAFTIMEIIIVVVILGVLAMVAIPKLLSPSEKVIAGEAIDVLRHIREAQMSYCLQNGAFATSMAALDIDVSNTSRFASYNILNNTSCAAPNPGVALANVSRQGLTNNYALYITSSGNITCTDLVSFASCATAGCPGGTCN